MHSKIARFALILISLILLSLACNLPLKTPQPQQLAQDAGTIQIVNDHVRGSNAFPGGKGLPDAREYGVCILSYNPTNPDGLVRPVMDLILAKDGQTTNYTLPPGTYTLQEWQMDSEINQDPLYSPECVTQVRPPEVILITTGNTVVFGSTRSQLEPGAFEVGNPANANCGGCSSAPGGGSAPTASAPTEAPVITGVEEQIYEINTLGAVYNDPTTPTIFTIYDTWLVTEIVNYHWNDAQGAEPGTIALQAEDGTLYGPWQAHTLPGQGGVPNAYWVVNPQVVLPPGTYTVIDSDPSTWAQNSETGGIGISWGKGIKQQ